MRPLSIRWRLTLWYGGVLAAVLAAFDAAVYLTMRQHLLGRIDQGLTEELGDVLYEVRRARDDAGLLEWLDRRFARHEGFDFQITRANGERFFVNQRLAETTLPPLDSEPSELPAFRSVRPSEGRGWRVVGLRAGGPNGPLTIQVARTLADFDHETRELLLTFLLSGPPALLAAVGGGYFLARRALAPVEQMTRAANRITAERLGERIEGPNPGDELGALAATLNRMIGRLEQSFTEMSRFTADAAHELRTPLAVIRSEVEVALRSRRSQEEYERVLGDTLEEVNRLSQVAEQLLFLSRQDAGLHPPALEEFAADELLSQVVGVMQPVAREKGVVLELAANEPCTVFSDPRQIRRVLYNLLDNAIKYTPGTGRVTVTGSGSHRCWSLTVADTGVGIPPEHLPHVFERFYRADPSRAGDTGGAGLGLAICRSIITALGGAIAIESDVGRGTRVRTELPGRVSV